MSDESKATSPQSQQSQESPATSRVPRRDALKGLGALAVSTTAFAAVGCSSDMMSEPAEGSAGSAASGTTAAADQAATAASSTKPAGSAGSAGMTKQASSMTTAKTPSSPATTSSAAPSSPAATSAGAGGAAPSDMAGSPATTAGPASAGAPAAGASAAGSGSAGMDAMASGGADLSSLQCILSPAMTEGPFFVEEKLNRSDLVMGESDAAIAKALPLALTIGIYKVSGMTCTAAAGLQVDIWHANAVGIYSDVRSGLVQATDTQGTKFLRGYQITNEAGLVQFATIYPGWYPSRTIHIHFKIRMPMGGNMAYDFTSQMFFDEDITKGVLAMEPYSSTPGTRMIFNDDDHIFNGTAANGQKPPAGQTAPGLQTMVTLNKTGNGYTGLLKVGLMLG